MPWANIPHVTIQLLDAREGNAMFWLSDETFFAITPLLKIHPELKRQRRCILRDGTREPEEHVHVDYKFYQDFNGISITNAERESITN